MMDRDSLAGQLGEWGGGANKKRFAQYLAALSDYLWREETAKETMRQWALNY